MLPGLRNAVSDVRGRSGRSTTLECAETKPYPFRGCATPSASGGASAPRAGGQFRIHLRGERVIEARDIREALRQVESLGTVEVTAVTREE